jgi:hypothetical protein
MINTTANIQSAIQWTQLDTKTLTKVSDIGSVGSDNALLNGNGNEQVNLIWHDVLTLPSGGTETINLISLVRTIFGQDVSVGFTNVKGIAIKNQSEDIGAYITITASGGAPFSEMFGGDSGTAIVHPKCAVNFSNIIEGWDVDGTNSLFYINDVGGSGVTVEIAVVGTSG